MSYCLSFNEETFSGDYKSREEAIREAVYGHGLEAGDCFYIGQIAERTGSAYFNVSALIEGMAEAAYDEIGEASEGWPDMSAEKTAQLEKLIRDFLDEHAVPSFLAVKQVERIEVTAEMVAKYGAAPTEARGGGA